MKIWFKIKWLFLFASFAICATCTTVISWEEKQISVLNSTLSQALRQEIQEWFDVQKAAEYLAVGSVARQGVDASLKRKLPERIWLEKLQSFSQKQPQSAKKTGLVKLRAVKNSKELIDTKDSEKSKESKDLMSQLISNSGELGFSGLLLFQNTVTSNFTFQNKKIEKNTIAQKENVCLIKHILPEKEQQLAYLLQEAKGILYFAGEYSFRYSEDSSSQAFVLFPTLHSEIQSKNLPLFAQCGKDVELSIHKEKNGASLIHAAFSTSLELAWREFLSFDVLQFDSKAKM